MTPMMLLFMSVTQTLNLPPGLLSAVCFVESSHVVESINLDDGGSPSLGLCGLKLQTARLVGYRGTAKTLQTHAHSNVYYAGLYLRRQLSRYGNDVSKGVAAYNAGKHRVNAKGEIMNRRYVAKVMKALEEKR